jgi:hypothetical protein
MLKELEEFKRKLQTLSPAPHEDVVAELYELVEPIEKLYGAEEVIPEVFTFMERCPEVDIGSPGPLVHFVEHFYPVYLELLVASIERQPTLHTVWMVNRILNSMPSVEQKERLITILRRAQGNPRTSASTKHEVAELIARQAQNG